MSSLTASLQIRKTLTKIPNENKPMKNLCSIYRFIVLSPVPCLSRSIKRPGLPRMGFVTNGTRFSQTEIPNRKFPNFFVNGKRPHLPVSWQFTSASVNLPGRNLQQKL